MENTTRKLIKRKQLWKWKVYANQPSVDNQKQFSISINNILWETFSVSSLAIWDWNTHTHCDKICTTKWIVCMYLKCYQLNFHTIFASDFFLIWFFFWIFNGFMIQTIFWDFFLSFLLNIFCWFLWFCFELSGLENEMIGFDNVTLLQITA